MGSRNNDRMLSARMSVADVERLHGYLLGHCGECSHAAVIPLRLVMRKLGMSTRVSDIASRCFCRMCGSKRVEVMVKVPR